MTDERIKQVIDAVINSNDESAEVAFHTYLGDKMKAILGLQNKQTTEITDVDNKDTE